MSEGPGERDKLERALAAIRDMRSRLERAERSQAEPVAVVGLACRFPGGVTTPEEFWDLLREGRDAVGPVPQDRWKQDDYYDPDPNAPGKIYSRGGAFLDRVDLFDAGFFSLSPREARRLDPQHRMLLECAWEALEDAAIAPETLKGSKTGVFVGLSSSDYAQMVSRQIPVEDVDIYAGSGTGACFGAGRVSYFFGFEGPSFTLDTACSSSLSAIDIAVRYLRSGACEVAMAGGVNAILSPVTSIYLCRAMALSPDGRCKTFDASADGYGRGEGCGMVVLKPLSSALAAGDRIIALIRGTASNNDGRSSAITVPNGEAQTAVMKAAAADARVGADTVHYVEAHGTGTQLGDPIEANAIDRAFGSGNRRDSVIVGSVKSNIAHLEAASGVAGFIKAALIVQKGLIPRTIHCAQPNPNVDWDRLSVTPANEESPWPGKDRLAGVSAFGFSGTNVHVIVGSPPETEDLSDEVPDELPFFLSARDEPSLRRLAARYVDFLDRFGGSVKLGPLCISAATGRTAFEYRLAVPKADGVSHLRTLLDDWVNHRESGQVLSARAEQRRSRARGSSRTASASDMVDGFLAGERVNHDAFWSQWKCPRMALPLYPFDRKPYWLEEGQPTTSDDSGESGVLFRPTWRPFAASSMTAGPTSPSCRMIVGFDQQTLDSARPHLARGAEEVRELLMPGSDDAEVSRAVTSFVKETTPQACTIVVMVPCPEQPDLEKQWALHRATSTTILILARLVRELNSARLALVTSGAVAAGSGSIPMNLAAAPLWGLGRVLLSELPHGKVRLIDVDATDSSCWDRCADELFRHETVEPQVALRKGHRLVYRLAELTNEQTFIAPETAGYRIQLDEHGVVERAQCVPDDKTTPAPGEIQVEVKAVALSFAEHPVGRGMLPPDRILGREFAGRVAIAGEGVSGLAEGDRVMGFASGCLASHVNAAAEAVVAVPEGLSFAQAATMPLSFAVAHYVLEEQLALEPGGTVLVGADDGAGFAPAILQVGSSLGGQMRVSGQVYPMPDRVQALTEESDLDAIVWFGLSPDYDLDLLAPHGRVIEVAPFCGRQRGNVSDTDDDPRVVRVDPEELLNQGLLTPILARICSQFESGALKPPRLEVLSNRRLATAFNLLPACTDGARVVVTLRNERVPPARGDGTYLVTGGTGGVGLRIVAWLIGRGVGRVVVCGRKPEEAVRSVLVSLGTTETPVDYFACDLASEAAISRLLNYADHPEKRLQGIFHAAGLVQDRLLDDQSWATFEPVMNPKVRGSWLLAQAVKTREIQVDSFVLFSSVASVFGTPGQANYAAANSYCDALAVELRGMDIPAVSVNWGPWTGAGMVEREGEGFTELMRSQGIRLLETDQALEQLDRILFADWENAAVMDLDRDLFCSRIAPESAASFLLQEIIALASRPSQRDSVRQPYSKQLEACEESGRVPMVAVFLQSAFAEVMGGAPDEPPDLSLPLADLGLDSLMGIQLRNIIASEMGIMPEIEVILRAENIQTLAEQLVVQYQQVSPNPGERSPQLEDDTLAGYSDDEIDGLLSSMLERDDP